MYGPMGVTLLDYDLSFVTITCVSGSLVYQLPLCPRCLKDPQMGYNTIYQVLLLTLGVVRWNKLPGRWKFKNKKNTPLTINNYLLKHDGVTTIYIYIYIYMYYLFLLYLRVQLFYVTQFSGERGFSSLKLLFLFFCLRYGHRISSLV